MRSSVGRIKDALGEVIYQALPLLTLLAEELGDDERVVRTRELPEFFLHEVFISSI